MAKEEKPPAGPWLDVKAAAAYLCVTPKALRESCRRGNVKFYKLGKLVRFRTADLDAALVEVPIKK
ncbi:MAG: helix-turn-helix domain-containing protein [Myxococcales bacterium]